MVPGTFWFDGGGRSRGRIVHAAEDLAGDWRRFDERIGGLSTETEALARRDPGCKRLKMVPDIWPIYLERGGRRDRQWWSALPGQSLRIGDEVSTMSNDRERDQRSEYHCRRHEC